MEYLANDSNRAEDEKNCMDSHGNGHVHCIRVRKYEQNSKDRRDRA